MARLLAAFLVLALAASASADYCTSFSTYTGSSCSVYLTSGQTISASTCSSMMSGASGSGDTVLVITGPTGSQTAYSDDYGGLCSALSYIPATTVYTSGYYTVLGRCYSSGSTCSGTVAYTVGSGSGSGVSCSGYSCSSCMQRSGCGWCAYGYSYGSSGTCQSATSYSGCSIFYSYAYYSSSVCVASSNSYSSGGGSYYNPYGSNDVSNKGWVAPALLTALTGITMITLTSIYGAMLCSDCACCGCAPTAADKRQPSVLDSPVGSMHWHSFAMVVLLPLSMLLVFVALCVDGYSQNRDDRTLLWGAFSAHSGSDKVTYSTFCPGPRNGVITSNDRMCPSLRTAGAMTFIANILAVGTALGAVLKFSASTPYAAAGKTATQGGKPVIPLVVCRLVVLFMVLNTTAVIMWLVGGHSALVWSAVYNANDGGAIQLGVSWSLMFVSMILTIPGTAIARREAVREQPKAANQQSAVPGQSPQSPMQSVAPMQPMGVNMGFAQQPYSGQFGGQPSPVYGQPMYGQPMPMQNQPMPMPMQNQQVPMQPMQQQGFAPQYGAQQPVVVVNQPPPAYGQPMGMPMQQQPMVVQTTAPAVVRVPVVPPAGLALPPGSILYSNGDVCDASGNVLGVVPGMQAQNGAQVVMAGTA